MVLLSLQSKQETWRSSHSRHSDAICFFCSRFIHNNDKCRSALKDDVDDVGLVYGRFGNSDLVVLEYE